MTKKKYRRKFSLSHLENLVKAYSKMGSFLLLLKVGNGYKSASFIVGAVVLLIQERKSLNRGLSLLFKDSKRHYFINGFRICCSGRLSGVEKAKVSDLKAGQTSSQIFTKNVDYASGKVSTKYGIIGIKVWISFCVTPNRIKIFRVPPFSIKIYEIIINFHEIF